MVDPFEYLCANESRFIDIGVFNLTVLSDCYLHLILLLPVSILFLFVNAYLFGSSKQLSRHVNSIELLFYRIFTSILVITSLTRITLHYFVFDDKLETTAVGLTNDLFQLISITLHCFLVFNKAIFKNFTFSRYPIGLFLALVVVLVVDILAFVNQILKYLYLHDTDLFNLIFDGVYSATLLVYTLSIILFYVLKVRRLNNAVEFNSEEDQASYFSYLTLIWVNGLMSKGYRQQLNTIDDIPTLPRDLNIDETYKEFMKSYTNGENINENPIINPDMLLVQNGRQQQPDVQNKTLKSTLIRFFGWKLAILGIIKLLNDTLMFAGPLLLNKLVEYIEMNSMDLKLGCIYASALFLASLVGSFLNLHYSYSISKLNLRIQSALIGLIYTKTVQVQFNELNNFSIGQIVNFMSSDSQTIVDVFSCIHDFWSIPFQITITLYLLYKQIGLSFLAGLAFIIIMMPINKKLSDFIGECHKNYMKFKDARVKTVTELLQGIRVIKFYSWEKYFTSKINGIRESELKQLAKEKYTEAFCVYFWTCTPILMSVFIFVTYVLLGNELIPSKVFTSLALFNMLIAPLNSFPWVLNALIQGWISLKRLEGFLQLKNLKWKDYYRLNYERGGDVLVNSQNATFKWIAKKEDPETLNSELVVEQSDRERLIPHEGASESEPVLNNVSFKIERSKLIGVIGKVGSGKTSMLNAILAEITKSSDIYGQIEIDSELLADGFAYVAQDSWVLAASIRENILFGQEYDEEKYNRVLYACALLDDLKIMPQNDLTLVGENGITLSGGQKARICLARACYQDKSVYLLDDPLSAVDTHVAKHIYDNCINGLLAKKTRILCTHHLKYLFNASKVFLIENNTIKEGVPSEIIPEQMKNYMKLKRGDTVEELERSEEDEDDGDGDVDEKEVDVATKSKKTSDPEKENEEEKEYGSISFRVYKYYFASIGMCLTIFGFVALILMQTTNNATDWWLSYWTQHQHSTRMALLANSNSTTPVYDFKTFLLIYASICVGNSVFTVIRAFSFAYSCLIAGRYIHNAMLKNILSATVKYFGETPSGRIINRLSSDMRSIDDSLPFVLNIFCFCLFSLIGIIVIACYSLPWFSITIVPLMLVYYFIQSYYRWTSRELKRLSSVLLSPVFTHFNETLNGLVTIRSFRKIRQFMDKEEGYLKNYIRALYVELAAQQWLNFRLQIIGVTMITIVSFIGVFQHIFAANVNASLIGLALAYILNVTGVLNTMISTFTSTEKNMVSVERAYQFQSIENESWEGIEKVSPEWPHNPTIEFQNVCLKYLPDAPNYALDDLSFKINAGEKIGIVGRTGSGKSSLLLSLFRAYELNQGRILVDGVSIRNLDLATLRERIGIIPQDPFLFSGTLRENLDPYQRRSDQEIWDSLEKCRLTEKIRGLNKGLELEVEEHGKNFSAGEKQLVCLARAILSQTRILCIDEATSSVDFETDNFIQASIRNEFKSITVLTIAHRLNTIIDYDKVIVMNSGKIAEYDTVANLMANRNSLFYALVDSERKQEQQKQIKNKRK